ncbi:MAG: YdeI/OmpD-associated family protein [Fimbriimonas sp.]
MSLNHETSPGIWLVTYKKGASESFLDYNTVVEEALCFGWVDSLPRSLDESKTMLYFAPRKPKSGWSKLNKDRVERILAAGKMQPAGLAKIEAAKLDGSWSKLDAVDALEVPDDLANALGGYPQARENWDQFPPSTRRGILEWILNAKRPETRRQRVEETVRLAGLNERANQWKRS